MDRSVKARELFAGMWLRRWLLGPVALGLFGAGALVVLALPREYKASAVVAVGAQHPSAELVLPTVSSQPEDRLKVLHAELLAAPRLRRIVDELHLYPATKESEARVAALRSHLDLAVEGDNVFTVTFSNGSPRLAAAVANRLPELYSEDVRRQRLADAERVAGIFGGELDLLRNRLRRADSQVASFKVAHLGNLPEQLDGNLRGLDRISLLEERGLEAMMDARRRRSALLGDGNLDATVLGRLRHRTEDLAKALTDARATWTERHPEVQRLEREIAATRAQARVADADRQDRAKELRTVSLNIAQLAVEQEALAKQEAGYRQRVAGTPATSDALARLVRDRDASETKYQALLGRQVEAELSLELERRQRTSLIRVIAPATEPEHAAQPDRATGLLLVAFAALALAGLLGAGLEILDDSIKGGHDASVRLGVPVLAIVPSFPTGKGVRLRADERA